jgi:hypothetical protein
MEDSKFKFEDGRFVNRVSGEAIPDDEPIFIFRARDYYALQTLEHYRKLVGDDYHRQAIDESIYDFRAFKRANPARMKEPGITRHMKLKGGPK